jgi:N-acetylglucosamine kinase-like BadF-type ATPase
MILVCDSGSTKADWILGANGKVTGEFNTIGFNPYFQDIDTIETELRAQPEIMSVSDQVDSIYFFGAGCSSKERNAIVEVGLKRVFRKAYIEVNHDVLASAIATCGDQPGIACIIGTGSNSCYFDGKEVQPNNYGLGYIMGDEASGSYLGKLLLTHYLYGILPDDLTRQFNEVYGPTGKDYVINHVYKMPGANVWLASYAQFLTDRKDHPWVKEQVLKAFDTFLRLFVCSYPDYKNLQVHFIGSIAWFFRELLIQSASVHEVTIGKIIRKPINDLADYYILRHA